MAEVKFQNEKVIIYVEEGTTVLQAVRSAGLVIESPCNGVGICGKCKVKLSKESVKNIITGSDHHLSEDEEADGFVLSCQTKIVGNIEVESIKDFQNKNLKILSDGETFDYQIDSYVNKKYVENKNITEVYAGSELIGNEEGNTAKELYGIVVDIGTTTLVTSLIDIKSGTELENVSSLNPQSLYAQDVLSRIKFASEEEGLNTMYSAIINEINKMISEITGKLKISKDNIYEIIFSGNTTMLHLAANVNPYSLGKYPYVPELKCGEYIKSKEHNLDISKFGLIYLPPIISAYVGADITSGILAVQLYKEKGITLFVDIGTNGEMAISINGKLYATSTAAGPAFEGMNINCGMRAGKGAVELFNVEDDISITVKTIGNVESTGICGSGLLDIVGELVNHGVITSNGKFVDPEKNNLPDALKERLEKIDGKTIFKITSNVYLSQKDIRQVQLAKGAVRAGIEFLLKSKEISPSEVDRVLIAGSFGYHLRAKSLINIGLLPQEFNGKIEFVGNTSKTGGQVFLLNKHYRDEIKKLTEKIEVVELANCKDFDKVFVKCLGF
ncbi:MAG: ASKHA domain-containing protein [Bacillota bacterium]|nr:ASKHA domain-containing protein [Bacillota bacterium]